jgi:hypothetical protein
LAQGPFYAIAGGGDPDDDQTSIYYDADTGEVGVNAPISQGLTAINIDSRDSIFADCVADPTCAPMNLDFSMFDVFSDDTIFKATFSEPFGTLSFGFVAPTGLSEQFILDDFTVDGSLEMGGDLGDVDLIYIIPEPSGGVLITLGLAMVAGLGRRRRGVR